MRGDFGAPLPLPLTALPANDQTWSRLLLPMQGPWGQQLMRMVPALASGGSASGLTPDHSHVRSRLLGGRTWLQGNFCHVGCPHFFAPACRAAGAEPRQPLAV